jgi:hypothetical protein
MRQLLSRKALAPDGRLVIWVGVKAPTRQKYTPLGFGQGAFFLMCRASCRLKSCASSTCHGFDIA